MTYYKTKLIPVLARFSLYTSIKHFGQKHIHYRSLAPELADSVLTRKELDSYHGGL